MNFIKKILPSKEVNEDIDFQYNRVGHIEPIGLNKFSFIYPIKKKLLKLRKEKSTLNIDRSYKKMCLIIPYRNRKEHLEILIPYIKTYLENQGIDFEILVVEQADEKLFNKAKLYNIGVLSASDNIDYFAFHDVDLLPENIDYRYCNHSLKPFIFIKKQNDTYTKYKPKTFGGLILVPKDIFYDINGFSNHYVQWGSEDDDFHIRHLLKGHITLYDTKGKLIDLGHPPTLTRDVYGNYVKDKIILKENKRLRKKNKDRLSLLKRGISKQDDDGIEQLKSQYISMEKIDKEDYQLIRVSF